MHLLLSLSEIPPQEVVLITVCDLPLMFPFSSLLRHWLSLFIVSSVSTFLKSHFCKKPQIFRLIIHLPVFLWEVSLEVGRRWKLNQPQQTWALTMLNEDRRLLLSLTPWLGKHQSWDPGWNQGKKQRQSLPAVIQWTQTCSFRHQFVQVAQL